MEDIYILSVKKEQYKSLLEKLNALKTKISVSEQNIQDALTIETYFSIDSESADSGKIKEINKKIESLKNKIESIIIPSVENKLNYLSTKITQLDDNVAE